MLCVHSALPSPLAAPSSSEGVFLGDHCKHTAIPRHGTWVNTDHRRGEGEAGAGRPGDTTLSPPLVLFLEGGRGLTGPAIKTGRMARRRGAGKAFGCKWVVKGGKRPSLLLW